MKTKTNAVLVIVSLVYLAGLCNAGAFYDPGEQRWLNRDPIGELGVDQRRVIIIGESKPYATLFDTTTEILLYSQSSIRLLGGRVERLNVIVGLAKNMIGGIPSPYHYNENAPTIFSDPLGLDSCPYFCFRMLMIVPIFACSLQDFDACDGNCPGIIIISFPNSTYPPLMPIIMPYSTPCNGCPSIPSHQKPPMT